MDVWFVRLTGSRQAIDALAGILSPDEQERASRFKFDEHRDRFILARGALRTLIGSYLGEDPQKVRFVVGEKGKPALADATVGLQFNLSHSADRAVYAFALNCEVGVDIEKPRPVPEMMRIANRFFSPQEAAELESEPEPARQDAFFRCWTRKEAYIKAVGGGMSIPLDGFRVTLKSGEEPRIETEGQWNLHHLNAGEEFIGALAYPGPRRAIRTFGPVNAAEAVYVQTDG